eukprot:scaffold43320_cov15-Tisochrysis_lutea.AAC.1
MSCKCQTSSHIELATDRYLYALDQRGWASVGIEGGRANSVRPLPQTFFRATSLIPETTFEFLGSSPVKQHAFGKVDEKEICVHD